MSVFLAGLVIDLIAIILWVTMPPRRTREAVPDWAVTPAAMLRTGHVREYGNVELARHVRITRALLDARGRRP